MKYLSILLLIISINGFAHEKIEQQSCAQPANTGRITSDIESEMFQAELLIYERCMFDYIRAQHDQADVHDYAADVALELWNEYLRSKLRQ